MGKTEYLLITIIFNLFFLLFMVAIIMYMWHYSKKKKENELMLQDEKDKHQKELYATQLEIQKKTMQEIGREIHDNVGQKITLAGMYLEQLKHTAIASFDEENINPIITILNDSLADLRQLSQSLSDDAIENQSLPELLKNEIKKIQKVKPCTFTIDDSSYSYLSYKSKSILLRILQEFVQNSIKHADCTLLSVNLVIKNEELLLSLSDNGKGFNSKNIKSEGIGLQNMKKRTAIIGAHFNMNSDSAGTTLLIKLPLTSLYL